MSICPPQSSDQVLYAGIITLYPKIIQRTRLGFPVSSGCRMTESYQHPVCNLVIQYSARSSEGSHKLIGNFPPSSPWGSVLFLLFFHLQVWHAPVRVHGLFPMILPQTSFKVWEGGKFSGSYGIVPMKWVAQLNDIRFSLPEFRGRSPTLIWMLYVQWTVCLFARPNRAIKYYNLSSPRKIVIEC